MTAGRITVDYRLGVYGWAHATISDGAQTAEMNPSYVGDALRSLLAAVLAAGGERPGIRHSALFAYEPGGWVWDLWLITSERVALSITWHRSQSLDDAGEVVFETECSWREIATAVATAANGVRAEDYEQRWGLPFPAAELDRLDERLA